MNPLQRAWRSVIYRFARCILVGPHMALSEELSIVKTAQNRSELHFCVKLHTRKPHFANISLICAIYYAT